jgi:hypothetical protein
VLLGSDAVKLPRRKFLHLAASAAALPAVSRIALAQSLSCADSYDQPRRAWLIAIVRRRLLPKISPKIQMDRAAFRISY